MKQKIWRKKLTALSLFAVLVLSEISGGVTAFAEELLPSGTGEAVSVTEEALPEETADGAGTLLPETGEVQEAEEEADSENGTVPSEEGLSSEEETSGSVSPDELPAGEETPESVSPDELPAGEEIPGSVSSDELPAEETDPVSVSPDEAGIIWTDISDRVIQAGGFLKEWEKSTVSDSSVMGTPDYEGAYKAASTALHNWNGKDEVIVVDVSAYNIPNDLDLLADIAARAINKNPDCFYVSTAIGFGSGPNTLSMKVNTRYNKTHVSTFNAKLNGIVAGVDENWTDLQKILYAHDYLVKHIDYDNTLEKHDAYNALIENCCVCQGYSLALSCLLNRIFPDAECDLITSRNLNHAWNLVTLDGKKYYIDATWDDPTGSVRRYCRYNNFLVSKTKFINEDHTSTDWIDIDGNNVYDTVTTGNEYDSFFWSDMKSSIPMVGKLGLFYKGLDPTRFCTYNFDTKAESEIFTENLSWHVWGGGGSWIGCFSSLGSIGSYFVYSTPEKIHLIDTAGTKKETYELTGSEKGKGYIYGLLAEDGLVKYDLYTAPNGSLKAEGTISSWAGYEETPDLEKVELNVDTLPMIRS
nr:hypothetical protein [Lachnospiraceae bacterium]